MVKKMKAKTSRRYLLLLTLIFAMSSSIAHANLGLKEIMYNGKIKCGVDMSAKTYGYKDKDGYLRGIGVELCKAYASATLGKEDAYEIVDSNDLNFERNLATKKIDIMFGASQLSAAKTPTSAAKDVDIMVYDTQGLLVRKKENAEDISSYANEKVCISTNPGEVYNIRKFSEDNNLNWGILAFQTREQTREAFLLKRCNMISGDKTYLISVFKNNLDENEEFEVLDDVVAIKPIYIYARSDNKDFLNTAKWIFNALKLSVDADINSNNIEIMIGTKDVMLQSLLGDNKTLWEKLNVKPNWLRASIKSLGNYDEIYTRTLGEDSEFKLDYPYNKTLKNGGILLSEPFL